MRTSLARAATRIGFIMNFATDYVAYAANSFPRVYSAAAYDRHHLLRERWIPILPWAYFKLE